jgi:hypothetical protein
VGGFFSRVLHQSDERLEDSERRFGIPPRLGLMFGALAEMRAKQLVRSVDQMDVHDEQHA